MMKKEYETPVLKKVYKIPTLALKRLHPKATLPKYATDGSSGMDLYSFDDVLMEPGEGWLIDTGWAVAIPEGYEGQVRPRSGLAVKHGITITNTPGTIDSDYRGEMKVLLHNTGPERVLLAAGTRIAQLVICPVRRMDPMEVEELPDTKRGEGGFGSTGT